MCIKWIPCVHVFVHFGWRVSAFHKRLIRIAFDWFTVFAIIRTTDAIISNVSLDLSESNKKIATEKFEISEIRFKDSIGFSQNDRITYVVFFENVQQLFIYCASNFLGLWIKLAQKTTSEHSIDLQRFEFQEQSSLTAPFPNKDSSRLKWQTCVGNMKWCSQNMKKRLLRFERASSTAYCTLIVRISIDIVYAAMWGHISFVSFHFHSHMEWLSLLTALHALAFIVLLFKYAFLCPALALSLSF